MLLDLEVLNGNMFLKFDKYVNTYTIEIEDDVKFLDIKYKIDEKDTIKILNNENLIGGLNYVFIEVTHENEKNMYTLEVYKNETKNVFHEVEITPSDEAIEKMPEYVPVVIISVVVLVILFTYWLLFHKKKVKR